jgi:hypothetical protein
MHPGKARFSCVVLFLMIVAIPYATPQIVKQGETPAATDKTIYTSPMILETVFAAADRSLWDPSKGHLPGFWFSAEEYGALGKFSCDGVYLRHRYNREQKTWEPGLAMSVLEAEGGTLLVQVRAMVDNPKKNHDRKVEIVFEALNGDTLIGSSTVKRGIEEGDEKPLLAHFSLPAADLTADPMTRLRLTVRVLMD